jgi:hypothetical protein
MAQDAIQSWHLMNSLVNCKMARDLLSNIQIIKMDCCVELLLCITGKIKLFLYIIQYHPVKGMGEWRYRSKDLFPRL